MKKLLFFCLFFTFLLSLPLFSVNADLPNDGPTDSGDQQAGENSVSLNNPLGEGTTPQSVIGRVINAILGIVGSLALLMFIYGGLTWMTSSGNQEKVTKGKNILMWATIGLVVIFSSYALVNFVITDLIGG